MVIMVLKKWDKIEWYSVQYVYYVFFFVKIKRYDISLYLVEISHFLSLFSFTYLFIFMFSQINQGVSHKYLMFLLLRILIF